MHGKSIPESAHSERVRAQLEKVQRSGGHPVKEVKSYLL